MEPDPSHPPSAGHPGPLRGEEAKETQGETEGGEGNRRMGERKQERERTVINLTLVSPLSI